MNHPRRNTILILCFIISFGFSASYAQSNTYLVQPWTGNLYQDSYVLPDSTIRLIGNEYGNYRGIYFVDLGLDGEITSPVYYDQSFGNSQFNFAGIECLAVPLKDGNAILGINQIACDYAPPSGLCLTDTLGAVRWGTDLGDENFEEFITKIILVDSQVVGVLHGEEKTFFNFQGNYVEEMDQFFINDLVANTPVGFLASVGSSVYRLDDGFHRVDSIKLDSTVLAISLVDDSLFLVSTLSSVYLVKMNFEEKIKSDSFGGMNLVAATKNAVWLSKINAHQLFQLDKELQPVDTFDIHEDILLKRLFAHDPDIILTGDYSGPKGLSPFIHKSDEEHFSFEIKRDITLDSITLDMDVFYNETPFSFDGYSIGYNDVKVHVTNTGSDTIQSIIIRYKEGTGCGMCDGEQYEWKFVGMDLYPGQSRQLEIGTFGAWCVMINVKKLCLWASPADDLPEIDADNNWLCVNVDAKLVSVIDESPGRFQIDPNPASDFLNIHLDENSGNESYTASLFNINGQVFSKMNLNDGENVMDIAPFPPGIYSLMIRDKSGGLKCFKVAVIR